MCDSGMMRELDKGEHMKLTSELIQDGQRLNGATYRSGYDIKTYDDGFSTQI